MSKFIFILSLLVISFSVQANDCGRFLDKDPFVVQLAELRVELSKAVEANDQAQIVALKSLLVEKLKEANRLGLDVKNVDLTVAKARQQKSGEQESARIKQAIEGITDLTNWEEALSFENYDGQSVRTMLSFDEKHIFILWPQIFAVFEIESKKIIMTKKMIAHDLAENESPGWHYTDIRYTADGKHFITATNFGDIIVRDAKTFEVTAYDRIPEEIDKIALHPDGHSFFTSGYSSIWHWSIKDLEKKNRLLGLSGYQLKNVSTAANQLSFQFGEHPTVWVHDLPNYGQELGEPKKFHTGTMYTTDHILLKNKNLLIASIGQRLFQWDTNDPKQTKLDLKLEGPVDAIVPSLDGRIILVLGMGGSWAKILEANTLSLVKDLNLDTAYLGNRNDIGNVANVHPTQNLLLFNSRKKGVLLIDFETGAVLHKFLDSEGARQAYFSKDGSEVIISKNQPDTGHNSTRIWKFQGAPLNQ